MQHYMRGDIEMASGGAIAEGNDASIWIAFKQKADIAQFENDIPSWFQAVQVLHKSAMALSDSKDETELKEIQQVVTKAYKEYNNYITSYTISYNQDKSIPFMPPKEVFELMALWDIRVRKQLAKN